MREDIRLTKNELEEKAYRVLSDLLHCDDERIRAQAVKLYSEVSGNDVAPECDDKVIKVQGELLESDDLGVRLKAVKQIYAHLPKRAAAISSPYEDWYKTTRYKNGRKKKKYSGFSFKEYWFKMTGYTPHESQARIHSSDKRFIVCVSGRRFGKSLMAAKEAEVMLMQPGKRIWIVAPTYALTDKVFREIYSDLVIKKNIDPKAIMKKSENERIIKLAWGSEVLGKSADNPDSLLGEAVDLLIFDECAKSREQIFEKYLRPTLTDRDGRAIFISTPEGTNWVYDLYLRGQRINPSGDEKEAHKKNADEEWDSFLFPTENNPHISLDDILDAKRTLKPEIFNQEYMADFSAYFGKVYKDFLSVTHTADL